MEAARDQPGLIYRLLRLFFKLLYHQMAWTYDAVAAVVSVGLWKDWVMSVLPYLEEGEQEVGRILELGHGPGHLQAALHDRGFSVSGLDQSPQMGRQAFRRLRHKGFNPLLVNGYAQFMPFASGSFHRVVATFPTDYIIDSHTLAEIFRVLAPGGALVVLPLAWITSQGPIHRLAAWLFRSTGQAPDRRQAFANAHWATAFRRAGFQVHIEEIHLKDSALMLIQARKSA